MELVACITLVAVGTFAMSVFAWGELTRPDETEMHDAYRAEMIERGLY